MLEMETLIDVVFPTTVKVLDNSVSLAKTSIECQSCDQASLRSSEADPDRSRDLMRSAGAS
jgi:hypothetical protein